MTDDKNLQNNPGCLFGLLAMLTGAKKKPETAAPETAPETKAAPEPKGPDYSHSYQAKYILTRNEWHEYKKLREYAEARNLRICPKVRLLDLVEPRKGEGFMSLLGKVQSKHVDFVVVDLDMHVKAIVELDDNSHNRPERLERDNFVDEVLTSVGY